MQHVSPDLEIHAEIEDFNREFIRLLISRRSPQQELLFGMPAGWRHVLADRRDAVADAIGHFPCLLPELGVLIRKGSAAGGAVREAEQSDSWADEVRVFAGSLLTYVWLAIRENPDSARLLLGLRPESIEALHTMSLSEVRRLADGAPRHLRTRFATHPRFWPDLLRSVRSSDHDVVAVARLAALPLLVNSRA